MTTSFETSLRMKELGFPQDGGEYYYYEIDGDYFSFYRGALITVNLEPLCRAFTLGELVRMLPTGWTLFAYPEKDLYDISYNLEPIIIKVMDIPEEAAAELAMELVTSGGIKFNNQNQTP